LEKLDVYLCRERILAVAGQLGGEKRSKKKIFREKLRSKRILDFEDKKQEIIYNKKPKKNKKNYKYDSDGELVLEKSELEVEFAFFEDDLEKKVKSHSIKKTNADK
jgi:hypothetical protein